MFVSDEVRLEVTFPVARERLAQLTEDPVLTGTSEDAYRAGAGGLASVGLMGVSELGRVQVRELAWTGTTAGLAIRWEATEPGGGLFPVLDADIRLAAAGARVTTLSITGVYRPSLGFLVQAPDRVRLQLVAAATIRNFAAQVAIQITGQPGPAKSAASNGAGASSPEVKT
jgi:hypothetical protein